MERVENHRLLFNADTIEHHVKLKNNDNYSRRFNSDLGYKWLEPAPATNTGVLISYRTITEMINILKNMKNPAKSLEPKEDDYIAVLLSRFSLPNEDDLFSTEHPNEGWIGPNDTFIKIQKGIHCQDKNFQLLFDTEFALKNGYYSFKPIFL